MKKTNSCNRWYFNLKSPYIDPSILLMHSIDLCSLDERSIIQVDTSCKTETDLFTKRIVYTAADKKAQNDGGEAALMRQFSKITLDTVPEDLDTKFVVAFIVETDGEITGERVIKDKSGTVGKQMIKIVKSFRWAPAECDGKKVPMLVNIPLEICLQ